ncbi:fatty acid desaturas-like protein [Ampelomyces quisqualis]|uniref:Fatty acid desaturas-like protein n=1 Tax=Ampelomyces quisqualis TaxID=50730 RepID=A0A6A5QJ07_AMPQU|nr:fatty acid desaturas-like protein [Ampelomyces quisqualis]
MGRLPFPPDAELTVPDRAVLSVLQKEYEAHQDKTDARARDTAEESDDSATKHSEFVAPSPEDLQDQEQQTIEYLKNLNNPKSEKFEPTIFSSVDLSDIKNEFFRNHVVEPYTQWARTVVRNEADVVMITHLLLYSCTTLPSAIYMFYSFRWWHAVLHGVMQGWYAGAYTLLKHQHIHARGVLSKRYALVDELFPYVLDPLMGHTWNSYYFHHVKHHHVEGNGPNDLSSTVRYQRDDVWDFARYVGRFYFLIWFDLPRYFLRTRKPKMALQAACSEIGNYGFLFFLYRCVNKSATIFVFLIPLALMRLALMTGNWGQHALVDELEPDSDFRSSITLIDVPSNRYCYNDGYHTSHHLNPLRHWREHPVAFLAQKKQYSDEHALVFYNIDYMMLTINLLRKNYDHIARCLVPMGDQMKLTHKERVAMLRRKTRKFSEEEIAEKWGKQFAKMK